MYHDSLLLLKHKHKVYLATTNWSCFQSWHWKEEEKKQKNKPQLLRLNHFHSIWVGNELAQSPKKAFAIPWKIQYACHKPSKLLQNYKVRLSSNSAVEGWTTVMILGRPAQIIQRVPNLFSYIIYIYLSLLYIYIYTYDIWYVHGMIIPAHTVDKSQTIQIQSTSIITVQLIKDFAAYTQSVYMWCPLRVT